MVVQAALVTVPESLIADDPEARQADKAAATMGNKLMPLTNFVGDGSVAEGQGQRRGKRVQVMGVNTGNHREEEGEVRRQKRGGKLLQTPLSKDKRRPKQTVHRTTTKCKRKAGSMDNGKNSTPETKTGSYCISSDGSSNSAADNDINEGKQNTADLSSSSAVTNQVELDTHKYSELISFCKQRDAAESELEELLCTFLRQRERLRDKMTNPWAKIEELADTTLSLQGQIDSLRASLAKARESAVVFRMEADNWRNVAERVDAEESQQLRSHKHVVQDLEEQANSREAECVQLRAQRDHLEREAAEHKALRAGLDKDLARARANYEALQADLHKWKRAAQSKAQEVGMSVKCFQKELVELRKFKVEADEKLLSASTERLRQQGDLLALEKQVDDMQQQLDAAYSHVDVLNTQLLEKSTDLQEKALALDHRQLDFDSVRKRLAETEENLTTTQEKLKSTEKGRVELYHDQEKRLDQAFTQLAEQQDKEDVLKNKLVTANEQVRQQKLEATAREEELEERIANLEGTLNELLKNMQTISNKQGPFKVQQQRQKIMQQQQGYDSAQTLTLEYHSAERSSSHVNINDDIQDDDDDLARNILSEKANRIRMEIQAAAEASFRTNEKHQQQDKRTSEEELKKLRGDSKYNNSKKFISKADGNKKRKQSTSTFPSLT